jgi:aspartate carbamoyltransferase catalytic subunit
MRDLVTIDDLSEAEIQTVFSLADHFLDEMGTPGRPHRLQGRTPLAERFVLATLFYEASTRTRLSFESAMLRLGGQYLSSADPRTSSASKGETLADTVRVVENYADAIVIRHPCEGAAKVAADYAGIPVINAGDGGHEHPTQTLCDLYTLQKEKGSLKNLNVMLCGDLKNGRTVHSLVYGLARFGARIIPAPASGFELPEHVTWRLLRDYDCRPVTRDEVHDTKPDELPIDVVYVTPDKPHQRSLFTDLPAPDEPPVAKLPANALSKIDAFYVTRLQRERMTGEGEKADYPVFDARFLKNRRYRDSRVLHPLPRVEELGYDIDDDARAVYFKQASYGVPVRMALMTLLLGIKPGLAETAPERRHRDYRRGSLPCQNSQCVTTQAGEMRYLRPHFHVIDDKTRQLLRCAYCEHDIAPLYIGNSRSQTYAANEPPFALSVTEETVFFLDAAGAHAAGFAAAK